MKKKGWGEVLFEGGGGGRRIEVIVKMHEKKLEAEELARINGCDRRIEN